jgi:hypothetical protein
MSLYRRVSIRMWGDAKFRALSVPAPNAQTLWLYLLTGEYTIAIPGVVRGGEAALAESLGWPLPAFRKAFAEIYAKDMARPDWSARLVFLPKALIHNPPQSPKVVIAWRKAYEELPDCTLKIGIHHAVKTYLEGFGEAFRKAFDVALPDSLSESLPERHRDIAEIETETENRSSDRSPIRSKKPDFEIWFDKEFIPAYPAKARGQYKTARSRLREIKPDGAERSAIMVRLEKWKATENWVAGKYIPGLCTFLTDPKYGNDPEPESRNGRVPTPLPPTYDEIYGGKA